MDSDTDSMTVSAALDAACDATTEALGAAGDWLDGTERVAVWAEARDAQTNPLDVQRRGALSPAAIDGHHPARPPLSAEAVELVHRLASDPGRLTKAWATECMAKLADGERRYTEIVGVTAMSRVIDRFDRALGRPVRPLPEPQPGEPARVVPDGVGDVGAWVSQSIEKGRANVSRTLSLVPVTQATWQALVNAMYSHHDQFADLAWDRPLSRPQTELVAARTTVLNQCFY